MSNKNVLVKVVTFPTLPNKKYYFFKNEHFVFSGILDFYLNGEKSIVPYVYNGGSAKKVLDEHKIIARGILKYKHIERVSFYGGGVEILLNDQGVEKFKPQVVPAILKQSIEEGIKDVQIIFV